MHILGTKVDNITFAQALKKTEAFISDGRQHYIVTPNPEIVLCASRNQMYRMVLNKASLSIPDGMGLIWASRVLYGEKRRLRERIAGIDFMTAFVRRLSRSYLMAGCPVKVLLLGGRNGVAHETAYVLKKKFPTLAFYALGNYQSKHLKFIINELIQPQCLFVALGAPKQEFWIGDNLAKLPSVKLAIGVGGAFDMICGKTPRAPVFFRRIGIEWIWRLCVQPWRIKRILNAVIIFPTIVMRESFKRRVS